MNWTFVSKWLPDAQYETKDATTAQTTIAAKLWVVPPEGMNDKQEFYRRIAEIITQHRNDLGDLFASDIEMVPERHPAAQGIRKFIRAPGLTTAHFSGNMFNGFYLPDGIILRSSFETPAAQPT